MSLGVPKRSDPEAERGGRLGENATPDPNVGNQNKPRSSRTVSIDSMNLPGGKRVGVSWPTGGLTEVEPEP